jgi:cytochrome c oxidase subunit I+III
MNPFHNPAAIRQREAAQARVRRAGIALDVSELPSFGFGHRSLMWWGTQGLMAVEGTVFALLIGAYAYIALQADRWPPTGPAPDLAWGAVHTLVALLSLWPNHRIKQRAEQLDLASVRRGMVVHSLVGAVLLAIRWAEFRHLNVGWDDDVYGSLVWLLLGLHTTHLATDVYDTWVLTALIWSRKMALRRFADVSENALYWYFVVWSWLPIWAVVYGVPRWL